MLDIDVVVSKNLDNYNKKQTQLLEENKNHHKCENVGLQEPKILFTY